MRDPARLSGRDARLSEVVGDVLDAQAVGARFAAPTLCSAFADGHPALGSLAKASGLTAGAVTQLVDKLMLSDLVERRVDPMNARVRRLRLTDAARA